MFKHAPQALNKKKVSIPAPIKEALARALEKMHAQKSSAICKEDINKAWEEAAGKEAARHSKPTQITKNTLVVNVDSSAWLYQLSNKKTAIEKTLNEKIRQKPLLTIRLRAGEL